MRTIKENLEVVTRGDGEDWFIDEGCAKSSNVARWSAKNCGRNGLNLANSMKKQNQVQTKLQLKPKIGRGKSTSEDAKISAGVGVCRD